MLLRFGVENFLSFWDYQEVSFISTALSDEASFRIPCRAAKHGLLPVIAVYGANASGKSNLLQAFEYLRRGVLSSHSMTSEGTTRVPFSFVENSHKYPSSFDCDFFFNDTRFHYGFTLDDEKIVEEWLYAFPKSHRQTWFYRSEKGLDNFYFGKYLRGENRTIESLTRSNSLFLSTAATNNHPQLKPIYDYFNNQYVSRLDVSGGGFDTSEIATYLATDEQRERIAKFLKFADTGICDIRVEELDSSNIHTEIFNEIRSLAQRYSGQLNIEVPRGKPKRLLLGHKTAHGDDVFLSIGHESNGTRHILRLLGPVYDALDNGKTLIVDELESSTHTLVARELVALFTSETTNPKGAQLWFSTHDTNLLSTKLLRRDEVWFTEKDSDGRTQLFPLSDIRTRKSDDLEKGYIEGRFGGVPFLNDIIVEKVEP